MSAITRHFDGKSGRVDALKPRTSLRNGYHFGLNPAVSETAATGGERSLRRAPMVYAGLKHGAYRRLVYCQPPPRDW
jgi:hypothetical protein